jgi:chromosome segregation ATPase
LKLAQRRHKVGSFTAESPAAEPLKQAASELERSWTILRVGAHPHRILVEDLSMSERFTAFRALEAAQRQNKANGFRSQLQVVASTVSAGEFAALEQLGASRTQRQPQAAAVQSADDVAAAGESDNEDETLSMSATEFAALEERVARVIEVIRQERQSLTAAEQRAVEAEARVAQLTPQIEALKSEVQVLKGERQHAHQRLLELLNELERLEF